MNIYFDSARPHELTEELKSRLRTMGLFIPVILRNQLRNRELILNNGVVIHLQGFSYLMRLEAECFA
ncbi:hypothetical protein, partial [Raoultella ornithinolytica]|uniref:hypothetical protein n=1 Tax=Raoultella ornithinolytica TaxID=54291 RepID=UPI003D9A0172